MLERFNPALKLICLALAALVAYQISRLALRKDPLDSLSFAAAPLLSSKPETLPAKKETNSVLRQESTKKAGTNSLPGVPIAKDGRSPAPPIAGKSTQTRAPRGASAPKTDDLPQAIQ